ncbi:MAG: endonuclease Q family protein [Chloroflexi bacterium]|nr:endonuclease Q family protein [Chloroflexota bacterium]
MSYAADLHLHSSYARATSPSLDLPLMARWASIKGIDLIASADFTHPAWLDRLERGLVPTGGDIYELAPGLQPDADAWPPPKFILGTEVSCIYPQGGRSHRVHLLLFAPNFDVVHKLCVAFAAHGSLTADGRPMLKLSSHDVLATALSIDDRCEVIPAHAWTPWNSVYGSKGGFDSLEDCFGDLVGEIHAVETGLSSDPSMNWRIPELDGVSLVSFSDAHSAQRMGREFTVFAGEPTYDSFCQALVDGAIDHTVEFFPEEGKYHYDGHRKCGVCQHPAVTLERGDRCPVCGRTLTVGVLNRIESLSRRPDTVQQSESGLFVDPSGRRPPFRRLVPLEEVIAHALGRGPSTKGVRTIYDQLIAHVGTESHIIQHATLDAIAAIAKESVALGVIAAREGRVTIEPGYDGVYGTVRSA